MRFFRPILAGANWPERLLACLGAVLGIALTLALCLAVPFTVADVPAIVAPLGASAVLVFAVPASPLAQPWSVVGGNILSTLVGVTVFRLVPDQAAAAGLAVGAAILVMSLARCLHPPGGAAALTAVIGGHGVHEAGYAFALVPIGINSIALVSLAMLFHRLSPGRYPHQPAPLPAEGMGGLHLADIDAALEEMDESFDIAREDLDALLARAELHAVARRTAPPRGRRR